MKRRIPRLACLDHCIEDGQHFAYTGDQRDLLHFPCAHEAVVKRLDDRIELNGDKRCYVQKAAYHNAPAEDRALAMHEAGNAIGLCQLRHCAGEVTRLLRVNDCYGMPSFL